jgi:GNAT superfamily N-acetyltransferase
MRCLPLREQPHWLETLLPLLEQEWGHLYPGRDTERVREELMTHGNGQRVPEVLIAVENDRLLGTVSIVENDLPGSEHLNPWLASLYVLPEHRGRGVARTLVQAAEAWAKKAGISRLYLFTESAGGLFESLGWQRKEAALCNDHPVVIYRRDLLG